MLGRPVDIHVEVVVRLDCWQATGESNMFFRRRGDMYPPSIGPEKSLQSLAGVKVAIRS